MWFLRPTQPSLLEARCGFHSKLVPTFREQWKRHLHLSLGSWLRQMPAWISQLCVLSCSAANHTREPCRTPGLYVLPSPCWALQWDDELGLGQGFSWGASPKQDPRQQIKTTNFNCILPAGALLTHHVLLCIKACERGVVPHLPFLMRAAHPYCSFQCFPVCSSSLCFGWIGAGQNKLGSWADATWLQTDFKLFCSEMLIIFIAVYFLAQFRSSLIPLTTERFWAVQETWENPETLK